MDYKDKIIKQLLPTHCKMHRLGFPSGDMNADQKFVYFQTKLGGLQRLRHLTAGTFVSKAKRSANMDISN